MRDYEPAYLTNCGVDLPSGTITVHAKGRTKKLPIHPFLYKVLSDYWKHVPDARQHLSEAKFLFIIDEQGQEIDISLDYIHTIFSDAGKIAGYKDTPEPYAWRHLFNHLIVEKDMPIETRRYLMGHQANGAEFLNGYLSIDQDLMDQQYTEFGDYIVKLFNLQG